MLSYLTEVAVLPISVIVVVIAVACAAVVVAAGAQARRRAQQQPFHSPDHSQTKPFEVRTARRIADVADDCCE